MAIINIDNRHSSRLAMIAGIMILITRLIIPQFYPSQATNGWANLFTSLAANGGLSVFAVLAGIIYTLVEFGGISIFIGGLLCYRNHLRSGKEFVGIGTTFGFADLIGSIPLLTSSNIAPVYWVAVAWLGLFFAVFANRHLKGPSASYAGEVRKLVSLVRSRFVRQEKKRRRERRSRRRRSLNSQRPNLAPSKK